MRVAWESAREGSGRVDDGGDIELERVHNRRLAWPVTRFRPGMGSDFDSGGEPTALPTEEGTGRGPPG